MNGPLPAELKFRENPATVYKNTGEEYRLPQITIGAKEKWQPYLGDLSIIIWVRYYAHTHTHKHKTHTRACALNTKTNKENKES